MILLKEILSDRDLAFKGNNVYGDPFITVIDNFRVFLGRSVAGSPAYSIVGDKLFSGMMVSGRPLATLVGDLIFLDIQTIGSPLARIVGTYSFEGMSPAGYPIVTVPSKNINTLFAATYHALRG
jgi:hypothetical protein